MSFSESIKLGVKKKAMFRCCRCQNIGIDVHHIIPEKDHGPDTFDNAAPLCQNCHDQFGDNPVKRKEITQMRNHWYETVEKMYPNQSNVPLQEINEQLKQIQINNQSDLSELKSMLRDVSDKVIDNITPGTATVTASGIVNTSAASISSVKLGDRVHANFVCNKCRTRIGLLIGSNNCPNCGQPI